MGNWFGTNMMSNWSRGFGGGIWFVFLIVWELVWKGLALWKAARNDQRYWFVALLIVNTAGILEILYLFVFAKSKLVLVGEPKSNKSRSRSKK